MWNTIVWYFTAVGILIASTPASINAQRYQYQNPYVWQYALRWSTAPQQLADKVESRTCISNHRWQGVYPDPQISKFSSIKSTLGNCFIKSGLPESLHEDWAGCFINLGISWNRAAHRIICMAWVNPRRIASLKPSVTAAPLPPFSCRVNKVIHSGSSMAQSASTLEQTLELPS